MKNYRFNYGFLASWQRANRGIISRDAILDALGNHNKASFASWKRGDNPLPIESLLRLCNTFDIPLEKWFFDNDEEVKLNLYHSSINDQTEPTGGLVGIVSEECVPSVMPVSEKEKENKTENDITELQYLKRLDAIRKEYENKMETMRKDYMQSIAMLTQQIAELRMALYEEEE
jgi:transcriptional regulator with XRE-family HTH domain